MDINPFITNGYISSHYFCDREVESAQFIREMLNGNNLTLISTRRMGKTGLIKHCFQNRAFTSSYHTFFVDIYASKSLRDFVFLLSKEILEALKPKGKKVLEEFWLALKSLQAGISFDASGVPLFNIGLGDVQAPEVTLDEIFTYLNKSNKPCIVAIDEFQQIASYPEKNMEAILRTYVQKCKNTHFIFAGSQHHVIGNMFLSAASPFYQSASMMYLDAIDLNKYQEFVIKHFKEGGKTIVSAMIAHVYHRFEGVTWYVQKMMNVLYGMTDRGEECKEEHLERALQSIVDSYHFAYSEILFRMPDKQKELLIAITKEGKVKALTSATFVQKYKLTSSSSVQSAVKGLLDKDYITLNQGEYQIYDKFFGVWLLQNY